MDDERVEPPRWFVITDEDGDDVTDQLSWRRRGDRLEGEAPWPMTVNGRRLLARDVLSIPISPELLR